MILLLTYLTIHDCFHNELAIFIRVAQIAILISICRVRKSRKSERESETKIKSTLKIAKFRISTFWTRYVEL